MSSSPLIKGAAIASRSKSPDELLDRFLTASSHWVPAAPITNSKQEVGCEEMMMLMKEQIDIAVKQYSS